MEEVAKKIDVLQKGIESLYQILNIEDKRVRMAVLQERMAQPDFWGDQKAATAVVEELKPLKSVVDEWEKLDAKLKEVFEIVELNDASYEAEIAREVNAIEGAHEKLRLQTLFFGRFDSNNAILEINAGAGGTEACDWTGMLFRMYARWCEEKKFKLRVLSELRGDEAGIKNVTLMVQGRRAYGLLTSERGVHRLVRISPFDSNKRRHTSFASVDVLPEIKDEIDIQIKPEELRIDTYRSSGAGGQHVNVTDSAVRITHLPTGIVTVCQNERSQHQNKLSALQVLKAKLYELQEEQQKKELDQISGAKRKIEWGSQIRSYVLHPYLLVKDHRTEVENHDAKSVLDGNLEKFMYAYLQKRANDKEANV